MAQINYRDKIVKCKIVYFGAGFSGKTANVQCIQKKLSNSISHPLISLDTETERTLYFDFLNLGLGEIEGFHTSFNLFTSPGQENYESLRRLVLDGLDGIVFVVDSRKNAMAQNIESLKNLKENLSRAGVNLADIPVVIQYNKQDLPELASVQEMESKLNASGFPFFLASAVKGDGVIETLRGIGKLVLKKIDEQLDRSKTAYL